MDDDSPAKEFIVWLFLVQHRRHTIIAHCFRSYDGHFISNNLLENQHKRVKVVKRGTQILDLQYEKAKN